MDYKNLVDKENSQQQKEIEEDYKFVEDQLFLLDKNKEEMAELRDCLNDYEKSLDNQQRKLNEDKRKF